MSLNQLPDIGPPRDRVDGRLKVTGAARYAADWPAERLAYGYVVTSTIANGRIASIDTALAARQAGVIAIMTHQNAPRVQADVAEENIRKLTVLQDDIVYYDRQPVAVVIADSFARAKYAAALVDVASARHSVRARSRRKAGSDSRQVARHAAWRCGCGAGLGCRPCRQRLHDAGRVP